MDCQVCVSRKRLRMFSVLLKSSICLANVCLHYKIFGATGTVVEPVRNYPVKVSQDVFLFFMVHISLPL